MDATSPNFRPFVGDSSFVRGLEVGITLASASIHNDEGLGMSADVRRELIRRMVAKGEKEESGNRKAKKFDVHDNDTVNIYNGIDAETVASLIKLAQGKEAAA